MPLLELDHVCRDAMAIVICTWIFLLQTQGYLGVLDIPVQILDEVE